MWKITISLYLVAGFNPSEKYWSNGIVVPNIWENIKCSNQIYGYGNRKTIYRPVSMVVLKYWSCFLNQNKCRQVGHLDVEETSTW
jgi:hypothetical protein